MRFHLIQHIIRVSIIVTVGILPMACELFEKKTANEPVPVKKESVEKTETTPPKKEEIKKELKLDLSKLTLDEIHNLPDYKDCQKRLTQAEEELKKRPIVKVTVKTVKGLSDELDLDNVFYLEPVSEKYPTDSAIRNYQCPERIEDVRVTYKLKQGPGFSSLYQFTYYGDQQGINVSDPSNPEGQIETRFGDGAPLLTLNIDKMEVKSLSPKAIFSNQDMDFTLEDLFFDTEDRINIKVKNKTDKSLAIRKFRLTIGDHDINVDFKKDILKLKPGELLIKLNVKAGRSNNKWFVNDGGKLVIVIARIVYQVGWDIRKLQTEKYAKTGDLGVNLKVR